MVLVTSEEAPREPQLVELAGDYLAGRQGPEWRREWSGRRDPNLCTPRRRCCRLTR
jgi:hypothetical protein